MSDLKNFFFFKIQTNCDDPIIEEWFKITIVVFFLTKIDFSVLTSTLYLPRMSGSATNEQMNTRDTNVWRILRIKKLVRLVNALRAQRYETGSRGSNAI